MDRRSHGVRGRGLRGRAEIELHAGRNADLEALAVEPDAPPSRRAVRDRQKAPVASANSHEGAVVTGETERAADGGVDEPTGASCDVYRERDGFEQAP